MTNKRRAGKVILFPNATSVRRTRMFRIVLDARLRGCIG